MTFGSIAGVLLTLGFVLALLGIALKLLDTRIAADAATRMAVVRLIRRELKDALRRWERDPPGFLPAALQLKTAIPSFKPEDCPLCKEGKPVVKPGSRPKPS